MKLDTKIVIIWERKNHEAIACANWFINYMYIYCLTFLPREKYGVVNFWWGAANLHAFLNREGSLLRKTRLTWFLKYFCSRPKERPIKNICYIKQGLLNIFKTGKLQYPPCMS